MSHDHQHDHGPAAGNIGRAFAIGIALNVGFVMIEAFYGWRSGSLALLADAAHNLSDVGGLVLAWAGLAAAKLRGDDRHTYGWQRGSILASFANAVMLLVAMGSLAWEAAQRLQSPSSVDGSMVMAVAGVGVLINAVSAWLFMRGSKSDLNIRGAFLHMAADALVSAGVVLTGALYLLKGWSWLDPVVSLIVAGVVVIGTWSLFRRSLHLLFDGVPDGIDLAQVRECLLAIPNVTAMHDLHVWAMATSKNALTVHLVRDDGNTDDDELLRRIMAQLHDQFDIEHVTVQLESVRYAEVCATGATVCAR